MANVTDGPWRYPTCGLSPQTSNRQQPIEAGLPSKNRRGRDPSTTAKHVHASVHTLCRFLNHLHRCQVLGRQHPHQVIWGAGEVPATHNYHPKPPNINFICQLATICLYPSAASPRQTYGVGRLCMIKPATSMCLFRLYHTEVSLSACRRGDSQHQYVPALD